MKNNFKGKRLVDKLIVFYARIFNHPFKFRILNYIIRKLFRRGVILITPSNNYFLIKGLDLIQNKILIEDGYELQTLQCIDRILHSSNNNNTSKNYLDIGGNIGLTTFCISFKNINVYTFEPVYKNFSHLFDNFQINGSPSNITLLNVGFSDKNEFAKISCPAIGNNGSFAINHTDKLMEHGLFLTTIDSFAEHYNIKDIELIKLDVEGYEMIILKGFKQINTILPKNIIMEFTIQIERTGFTKEKVIKYFTDLGYDYYDINGIKHPDLTILPDDNIWFKLKMSAN